MKRILKSWVVLVLCLSFLFLDSGNAKADLFSGTRAFYGVMNIAIDLYHACHVFGPLQTSYCSTSAICRTTLLYN